MKNGNYPLYETTVFENIRIMVEEAADRHPDRTAFSYKLTPLDAETVRRTYEEVRLDVRAVGTMCHQMGLCRKTAAILGAASYGWAVAFYATFASGMINVPVDKELPAEDIAANINKTKCEAIFYGAEIGEKLDVIRRSCPTLRYFVCMHDARLAESDLTLEELIEQGTAAYEAGNTIYYDYEIDPDALASIVYTSGTTGKGKGVMLSQTNIVSDMTQGMYNFAITPKTLFVLPPHHTFGSTVLLIGHFAQNSEIYISSGLKYFQKEMKEQAPSHLILVPLFLETLYKKIWANAEKAGKDKALRNLIKVSNALRRTGIDLRRTLFKSITQNFGGKLELVISGGAAMNQDIIDFFDAIGITLLNGYGITECAPLISCNRNKWQKPGSVGVPIIGEQVKIADPDENGEGEICVKGPNVMLGYFEDEEATRAAFDEEGFFKTGDYGRLDEDGWIYITGRLKNLIIFSNGKNVYPEEIETELSRIYGVNEAVVYAGESKAHPDKEVIVAEIYPDYDALKEHGVTDVKKYFNEEIKAVNARMASYKAIGLIKLRDSDFVRNTSRKITRFNLDKTIE